VRRRSVSLGGGLDQLWLIEVEPSLGRRRRTKYVHVHTPEELAAFERSKAISAQIRGDGLSEDEKWCAGGCGKLIRRERRSCGRRWCDAVRPQGLSRSGQLSMLRSTRTASYTAPKRRCCRAF
jgi:hypothetical protein